MTEMLNRRLLGKRTLRPQIGDSQRAFDGEALAHHFPEQAGDGFVGQRAFVQILNAAQHGNLALRTVYRARAFQFADGVCVLRAFVEQAQDFRIDGVDGVAVGKEEFVDVMGHDFV